MFHVCCTNGNAPQQMLCFQKIRKTYCTTCCRHILWVNFCTVSYSKILQQHVDRFLFYNKCCAICFAGEIYGNGIVPKKITLFFTINLTFYFYTMTFEQSLTVFLNEKYQQPNDTPENTNSANNPKLHLSSIFNITSQVQTDIP